ncbi:MAG TPA: hypothetical protein VFF27_01830 [Bacteroidia bacterium]|jgi:hypothetical protein|nr:hypothetical protein [Bacteroidia bacterium]
MKNKLFVFTAIFSTFAITANVLAVSSSISSLSVFIQGDAKIQIKPEELPEAIKKVIADKYNGWEISSAFWVKSKSEYYEVTLKKETDNKLLKFDKDGKPIEEVKD